MSESVVSQQAAEALIAYKTAISASLALLVMIVDFAWLIRDELKLIWPKLRSSRYAKIYILTRYPGLAGQIFNVFFTLRMALGISVVPSSCRMWYGYQAIMVQFLLAAVEGTLMHRIYALFLHSRWILLVLILFGVAQVASMAISARLSVPSVRYTKTCIVIQPHPGNIYFGATTMTTNVVIFFMTFWKYIRLPTKWTHSDIGRVVLRDSALSLLAISILMLFMTLCTVGVIRTSMGGNITYYWLVCTLWVSAGRIIINHEKLPRDAQDGGTWKSDTRLTSQIEIGEMISGSQTGTSISETAHTPSTSNFPGTLVGDVHTIASKICDC